MAVVGSLLAVLVVGSRNAPETRHGKGRVAVVRVEGMISGGMGVPLFGSGLTGSEAVARRLETLAGDPSVDAVILRLDSPGGTVAAGQEIAAAVDYVRDSGKVVVASMGDTAASAAYWIAARCNAIVAAPTTTTGSIGVIIQTANLEGLYRKLGVDMETIKSGPLKDMGSTDRPMSEAERVIFQGMVDDMFDQFVEAVAEGRDMSREEVLAVADGRVLTGRQAQALGLVDRLGFFRDAVEETANLAGLENPKVFEADTPHRLSQFVGAALHNVKPQVCPALEDTVMRIQ